MSDEAAGHGPDQVEAWREGLTMALYVSLSLLAVMAALPTEQATSAGSLALTVALTSIGLILAHQVAFRMSTRLMARGSQLDSDASQLLTAQLIGGAVITVLAVLPILILGPDAYRVSMGLLLLFVMVVGYLVARSAPTSSARALLYVGGVVVVVIGVLIVKSLVGH